MPETAAEVVVDRASKSVLIVLVTPTSHLRNGRPALQFSEDGAREIAARLIAGANELAKERA